MSLDEFNKDRETKISEDDVLEVLSQVIAETYLLNLRTKPINMRRMRAMLFLIKEGYVQVHYEATPKAKEII